MSINNIFDSITYIAHNLRTSEDIYMCNICRDNLIYTQNNILEHFQLWHPTIIERELNINKLNKLNNIDYLINPYNIDDFQLTDDEKYTIICPICCNILHNACVLDCLKHSFCYSCISKNLQLNHPKCPLCRQQIMNISYDEEKNDLIKQIIEKNKIK